MSHTLRNTRRLLAAIATLTLAAGPALAQPEGLERVEVRGGKVMEMTARHDVRTACADIEGELLRALARPWQDEGLYGEVQVRFVLENGEISTVNAKGISGAMAHKVRLAMRNVDCSANASQQAQLYRFSIDFVDPNALPRHGDDTRTAQRRVRINAGG